MKKLLVLLALAVVPLEFAWAEPAGRFGDAGTLSPSGSIAGAYATNTASHEASILFAPTVFYFVREGSRSAVALDSHIPRPPTAAP